MAGWVYSGTSLDTVLAADSYVRFPPRWHNVLVPVAPAAAVGVGISLYTASRPLPLLAQQSLWALSRLGGSRLLPGSRESWQPPMGSDVFALLWQQWTSLVGELIDGVAVHRRHQEHRTDGATSVLMLCAGKNSLLVRVGRPESRLDLDRSLGEVAARLRPASFRVPALRGSGSVAGWSWVAYEAMSQRPHRPARSAGETLTEEISVLVESVRPRPAGVPGHWRGAHGDLTPWNLRRAGTTTWLIDWEDVGWAPPGSDYVYFNAVAAAIRPGPLRPQYLCERFEEASAYWHDIIRRREVAPHERRMYARLTTLLTPRIGE